MSTLTDGVTVSAPLLVAGWTSERTARNVTHELIGNGGVDFTLRPAGPRTGSLVFLYPNLTDALAAESLAARGVVLTLNVDDTDRSELSMQFVVTGRVSLELDEQTQTHWTVGVDFTEVPV